MTTVERVQQVVASVLRVPIDKLAPTALLYQVTDLDSLTLAEIAAALDDEFRVRLPSDGLTNAHSIADLAALVDATLTR